jgi:hypothetical protein
MDGPHAGDYARAVAEIDALDADSWAARAPSIRGEDKTLSAKMLAKGWEHYAIKYNAFMGVISSYFSSEE